MPWEGVEEISREHGLFGVRYRFGVWLTKLRLRAEEWGLCEEELENLFFKCCS